MTRIFKAAMLLVAGLAGYTTAAQAEVLTIKGLTPAASAGFAEIETIGLEEFGGSDGRALAFALEDRLSSVAIFNQSYFDIIGGRSAVEPDAILSGNVNAGVEEYDSSAERRRCVERGENNKCITYKNIRVKCRTRVIDYRAEVRATRFSDGRSVFSKRYPDRNEQIICFGDDEEFASSESVIRSMVANTATAVRNDLAPREYRVDVRVLESRKGMAKADGKLFKSAVKMTKRDATEACRMWDEAARSGQSHVSLSYNRGLCAEQRGDLDTALALYAEANSLARGKYEVRQAIRRAEDHRQARDEWERRLSAVAPGRAR